MMACSRFPFNTVALHHERISSDLTGFADKAAGNSKDLSAWFNLFADLDPLANPDTVGKSDAEHELHNHA